MRYHSTANGPGYSITFSIYLFLYLAVYHEIIFSLEYFPIRDSFTFHYNSFHLFANFIVEHGRPPEWFTPWGGWPAGFGLPILFFFLPYKLIGYAGAITNIETLLLYKLSLAIGVSIVATVWHRMLVTIGFSQTASFFSAICLLFGGIGLTVFHQDQVLATVFWYPFILLAVSRYLKREVSIVTPLIFLGLVLSSHRPTIHLYTLLCALLLCLVYYRLDFFSHAIKALKLPTALIWFAMSLGPLIFLILETPGYVSPLRVDDIFSASRYSDYLLLNTEQKSSAALSYFLNYFWPGYLTPDVPTPGSGHDDIMNLSITRLGLILAFIGVGINFKKSWRIIPITLFLGWATVGIFGGLPKLLYFFDLPGVSSFRQWYHFSSLLSLSLCVFVAYGVDWIFRQGWAAKRKAILCSVITILITADGFWTANLYFARFGSSFATSSHEYLDRRELSEFFSGMDYMNFFATQDSTAFLRQCPKWRQQKAIAAPTQQLAYIDEATCPSLPINTQSVHVDYLPTGIELQVSAAEPMTVILPISHTLTKTVTVNDMKARYSNFHGLSSLVISPGVSTINATIDVLWQRIAIVSQLVAMAWGMLKLFSWRTRRERFTNNT